MKKIKYFIFSLICIFSCNIVFAENEVSIKSIKPVYDEDSSIVVTNENDNQFVTFTNKEQVVKYNVVIENTSGYELVVDEINSSKPTENYLVYELEGISKGDTLKSNETKELVISLKTLEVADTEKIYKDEILTSIDFEKRVSNPYTNANSLILISAIVAGATGVFIIIQKNKKISRYLALLLICFSVIPMAKAQDITTLKININVTYDIEKTIKMLSIGNSFSADSLEYVYQIIQELGYDNIAVNYLFIPNCTLATHLQNAKNDSPNYVYYTNTTGEWKTTNSYKISTAVQSEEWDYIMFQQNSSNSGMADTYDDLEDLIEIIMPMKGNAKLVWHMTWAYPATSSHSGFANYGNDQLTMYNAIVNAAKTKILTNENIDMIIPVGTTIQNSRTSYLDIKTINRDYSHLTHEFGSYAASLTVAQTLTGKSIKDIEYLPTNVSTMEKRIAIESAINAEKKPFEITKSIYTTQKEGYEQIDTGVIGLGYYNSSDPEPLHYIGSTPETSTGAWVDNYVLTKKFTKEELPIGTILEIETGYAYRPEGWINGARNEGAKRPGEVTKTQIVIDEEWWGDFTERAFNICASGRPTVTDENYESIASALKIYIPISK